MKGDAAKAVPYAARNRHVHLETLLYQWTLSTARTVGNGLFEHFAWLTYDSKNYYVPPRARQRAENSS